MTEFVSNALVGYRATFVYGILVTEAVLHAQLNRRPRFPLRLAAGLVLFFLLGLFFPDIADNAVIGSTLIFFLSVLLFWSLFENTLRGELFLCVSAYILQNMALNINRVIEILLRLDYLASLPSYFICLAVIAVIEYLVLVRRWHLNRFGDSGLSDEHTALMISITSICIIVTLNTLFGQNGLDYNLFARTAVLFCSCFALALEYWMLKSFQLKLENQIAQQLLYAERRKSRITQESIDIINMKCHDLKYELAAVQAGSRQERQSALERLRDAVTLYDSVAQTENKALDAVLTEKLLYCDKHGISLSYMVDQDTLAFLDSRDIYVLFGNALDNAIESVMREDPDKRIVILKICRKNGFLSIHLENYCATPPVFRDGLPQTTKQDVQHHGFGVRSIRCLVDQYGGHTVFSQKQSMFLLDIMIPVPG